jgi:hypothetical protein
MIKKIAICAAAMAFCAVGLATAKAPFIGAIDPNYGEPGDIIVLTGEFSPSKDDNIVTFAGSRAQAEGERVKAKVLWLRGSSKLGVRVPGRVESGPLTVAFASGKTSNAVNFTVQPGLPQIEGIEPTHGLPGEHVKIYGSNFEPLLDYNVVHFTGTGKLVRANVIQVIMRRRVCTLLVEVPEGAVDGPVTVTVGGNTSKPVAFTVDKVSPEP